MHPTPRAPRQERKWIPTGLSLADALLLVRQQPAAFVSAFPPRRVNNVYFDTPALGSYFEHISGVSRRTKVRVRWYGESDGSLDQPVLELKHKQGALGWKESFPLPALELEQLLAPHRPTAPPVPWDVPPDLLEPLRRLRPTLVNHYHRHYFRAASGNLRVTVDSALAFSRAGGPARLRPRVEHRPASSDGEIAVGPPSLVIELKFPESEVDAALAVAEAIPFRLQRFSKYVFGLRCLGY